MDTVVVEKTFKTYKIQPRVLVGLQYSGNDPSPDTIVSIEKGFVYTGEGSRCTFDGSLECILESGNSFTTIISGDIYSEAGSTMLEGVAHIGVGGSHLFDFSVNHTLNNFVKNIYDQDRYYSSSLQP